MEKSSQIAWKIFPLRNYFPLKVVPLIEVLLYYDSQSTTITVVVDAAIMHQYQSLGYL
jgi:hypothetical protein